MDGVEYMICCKYGRIVVSSEFMFCAASFPRHGSGWVFECCTAVLGYSVVTGRDPSPLAGGDYNL